MSAICSLKSSTLEEMDVGSKHDFVVADISATCSFSSFILDVMDPGAIHDFIVTDKCVTCCFNSFKIDVVEAGVIYDFITSLISATCIFRSLTHDVMDISSISVGLNVGMRVVSAAKNSGSLSFLSRSEYICIISYTSRFVLPSPILTSFIFFS